MNLFRTATATSLVVVFLTGCSSTPAEDTGISVPPSPSASPTPSSTTAPAPPSASPNAAIPSASPGTPFNSVPTGPPPGANKPSGIPKTPTDKIESPGWTEGWITRGGTGPCYGLVDIDGKPYAVYSDAGTELKKGTYVRARLAPSRLRIDCGEGTPVQMRAVEPVR